MSYFLNYELPCGLFILGVAWIVYKDTKNQGDKQMFTGVIAHDGEGVLREKACWACGGCTFVVQKKSGSLLARQGVVF